MTGEELTRLKRMLENMPKSSKVALDGVSAGFIKALNIENLRTLTEGLSSAYVGQPQMLKSSGLSATHIPPQSSYGAFQTNQQNTVADWNEYAAMSQDISNERSK